MSALDRYDEWEAALDDVLQESPSPSLEDIYDPETLLAIDHQREPGAAPAGGWRGGVTAGALVVGMVSGVRDVLEPEDEDALVEIEEAQPARRLEPVSVHLAWGNPSASIAIVRPWLF